MEEITVIKLEKYENMQLLLRELNDFKSYILDSYKEYYIDSKGNERIKEIGPFGYLSQTSKVVINKNRLLSALGINENAEIEIK